MIKVVFQFINKLWTIIPSLSAIYD